MDTKETNTKEVDTKDVDSKEVDSKKLDTKEANTKEVDSKEVDSKIKLVEYVWGEKRLKEIHTKPSPYAYEENYNRLLREEKKMKLDKAVMSCKEFLEEKLANGVLIFWKKTFDRTNSQYFDSQYDRTRRDLNHEISVQIRESVERGLEKGMQMVSNHEKDKLVKKIIWEGEIKTRKEAAEKAKKEADEKAKKDGDEKTKKDLEDKTKKEVDEKVKKETDENAKEEK